MLHKVEFRFGGVDYRESTVFQTSLDIALAHLFLNDMLAIWSDAMLHNARVLMFGVWGHSFIAKGKLQDSELCCAIMAECHHIKTCIREARAFGDTGYLFQKTVLSGI